MKFIVVLSVLIFGAAALAPVKYAEKDIAIPNKYIVSLKKDANLQDVMTRTKAFVVDVEFGWILKGLNAFVVNIGLQGLDFIRSFDEVLRIEQDQIGSLDQVASWGLDRTDQRDLPLDDEFYPEGDGTGVTVYVVDTGIFYDHNDYGGRAGEFLDLIGGNNPGGDCHGHGSHCAGTVGGNIYGVANNCLLKAVRIYNCQGLGSASDAAYGITYVGDNGDLPGVLSMSFSYVDSTIVDEAADYVIDRGFVAVTSSGNDNQDACFKSPQRNRRTISVGATTINDRRALYSNFGTCQDVWAPGSNIVSCHNSDPNGSATMSGTSMACPHVAGVAAVHFGLKPESTPAEVKTAIQNDASVNKVIDGKEAEGTPNLLLYSRDPAQP
ncbi:aqualysin-1-like [Glandiceps talaboti]